MEMVSSSSAASQGSAAAEGDSRCSRCCRLLLYQQSKPLFKYQDETPLLSWRGRQHISKCMRAPVTVIVCVCVCVPE